MGKNSEFAVKITSSHGKKAKAVTLLVRKQVHAILRPLYKSYYTTLTYTASYH
jgi:hypothetical protein